MESARHPLVGEVVASTSGRDKKRVFLVLAVTGDTENMRLAVADGRLRRTDSPKLKNPRHVRPVGHLTESERSELEASMTDETVRAILASYDSKAEKAQRK